MTTPRDAIAGLARDRLEKFGIKGELADDTIELIASSFEMGKAEAATQLDSLLKERGALKPLNDMLALCGELGGMQPSETPEGYLRRIIDTLIPTQHERLEEAKERDALQARVKELEEEIHRRDFIRAMSGPDLADKAETWHAKATEFAKLADENESRALRAEQERDEAVSTTRYKVFDNLLGAYIGANNEQLRAAIGNFAFMSFPEYRDELRKVAEERRLAGPEKDATP